MSEEKRIRLDECEFSVRTSNILDSLNIEYLDELKEFSAKRLLEFRNVGKKSVNEIRHFLAQYGISLQGDLLLSSQEQKHFLLGMKQTFVDISTRIKDIRSELRTLEIKLDSICTNLDGKK